MYDGAAGDYWQFDHTEQVAEFLADKEVIVYAHNGGKFDYHYLLPWINSDEPVMVIGQRLAKFRIGVCEFRDSVNLLPVGLSAFQKDTVDYSLFEADKRNDPAVRKIISDYLKSDCVNLWNFVTEFLREYGMHLTQAGAAMKVWAKQFGGQIPRQRASDFNLLRPFYYGGRVQCFAEGYARRDFKVVDINSAYPEAMRYKHPMGGMYRTHFGIRENERLGPCMVHLRGVSKGALPKRGEDGSLFFPCDERTEREYFATGWEVMAGLETGTLKINRILAVHEYLERADFADYVIHFYEKRAQAKATGDKARDIFAKILMNSLYGKFASNPEKYSEYILTAEEFSPQWAAEGYAPCTRLGSRFLHYRPLPDHKQQRYNIATAASITGYVRAFLWRSLLKCEGVLYCDTDSIAAVRVDGLDIGDGLGKWKIEMECDRYAIAGKKLYAFHRKGGGDDEGDWKIACKGVDLSPQEIVRVAQGERITYRPEIPTYSVFRGAPIFIDRQVTRTYRDISQMQGASNEARKSTRQGAARAARGDSRAAAQGVGSGISVRSDAGA